MVENDHFPEFDMEDNSNVAGYILTFIHENADGSKITKTRFVQLQHKEAVEQFAADKGMYVQEEVVDQFLSTLQ